MLLLKMGQPHKAEQLCKIMLNPESENEPNRTELEPDDFGSVRVYGSSEF